MQVLLLLIASLALALVRAATPEEAAAAGVLILDDDNFDEELENHSFLLVEFYAPWCGHCKSLAPEWIKAAKTLGAANSDAKLAQVDATIAKNLATRFGVQGFPTIKLFKNGSPSEYDGGRTEPEIVNWINKKSGPAAVELKTADDLVTAQEKHDVFVIGAFASLDSDAAKAFLKLADADDNQVYTITASADVKAKLEIKAGDAIVVLKTFDELRNEFPVTTTLDEAATAEFIAGATTPLIQTFSDSASKKIFGSPIKVHNLFFTESSAAHHETVLTAMTEVAKQFKGQMLFVNVPATESRVLDYFGIKAADLPALITVDMSSGSSMKKFVFPGSDLTVDAVSKHSKDFFAGALSATLKSEEPTPEDTAGDVKVVKGKSFADIVLNNSHDVLVEFYAPWCGHCKKLEPVYAELAAKLKSHKNIVIAKMDSTANEIEVPGVEVKGFPTLFLFKGDDKSNPIKYEGARELDDMLTYLESTAHNKFVADEL